MWQGNMQEIVVYTLGKKQATEIGKSQISDLIGKIVKVAIMNIFKLKETKVNKGMRTMFQQVENNNKEI